MSYRDKKVLFYDKGLYLYTAQKLGEYYDKVYYYMPDSSPYPCSNLADIGTGLPEIERVHSFWDYVDKVDMIVFPDVHDGNLQAWLRSKGYKVFGSGKSEELELDKIKFFDALEEAGLPIPGTTILTGTDELVDFLKGKTDRYIKTPTYRGDFETYHYTSMAHFEPWLEDLKYRLGSRCQKIEFIVQSPIKSACEAGFDGFCVDGKFTTNCLCGYEVKDQAYVCKIFDATPKIIDDVNIAMSPYLKDCRGHYSTEIRINDKGKGYFIDPTCYSDDTEVLTDSGWKFFSDLDGSETVCTLNPESRQIEYHRPEKYISYHYSGKMINLSTPKKTLDLLVTPNHSVWGSERAKANPIKEFRADSLPSKLLIPRTGTWQGDEQDTFTVPAYHIEWHSGKGIGIDKEYYQPEVSVPMDDWLRFLAIYLGDGSCSKYNVNISQYDKIELYESIISKLPFSYSRTKKGFDIQSVQLRSYLKQFGVCDQKFVPDYVKTLSSRQINIFLDAYILGDGEMRESGSRRIFTTSEQLANDMQELFLKAGSVADIKIKKVKGTTMTCAGRSYVRKRDSYWICERATFDTCWIEGQTSCRSDKYISEQDYDGLVFDVEVPNHILYVRRNGKPCWSGNCRIPSPPGELMCEIYSNYAESFWQIANGELPELKPAKLYGAEFILTSDWNDKHELCVEYPDDMAQWVKLKNHVKRGKHTYCIPNGNGGFFGAVVGIGSSLKAAIQNVIDVAENVKAEGFKFDSSVFDEASESVKAGEQFGIKY